eukprot:3937242-Prymnesium_polylepis.1
MSWNCNWKMEKVPAGLPQCHWALGPLFARDEGIKLVPHGRGRVVRTPKHLHAAGRAQSLGMSPER